MPKLSVYVPDELWKQTKTHFGLKTKGGASQVVQDALRQVLEERDARTAALVPKDVVDPALFEATVAKLRVGAQEEYTRGYIAGLRIAENMGYDTLSLVAMHEEFDVMRAIDGIDIAADAEWYDDYASEFDPELPDGAYRIFRIGVEHALRDIWDRLGEEWESGRQPDPSSRNPADVSEDT